MWWGDTRSAGEILKTTEDGKKFFSIRCSVEILNNRAFNIQYETKIQNPSRIIFFFSGMESLWRYRLFNFGPCASCVGDFFPIHFVSLEASRHNEKSAKIQIKLKQRTKEPRVNYENRNRKTFHPKHPKTRTQWEIEAKKKNNNNRNYVDNVWAYTIQNAYLLLTQGIRKCGRHVKREKQMFYQQQS